jgi:hypothetical protein
MANMSKSGCILTALLIITSFSCTAQTSDSGAVPAQHRSSPQLPRHDAVRIAEAYNLWKLLGDGIWPGWADVQMPMLFITADYEYAIGFPKPLAVFQPHERSTLINQTIQTRKRVLN